MNKWMRWLGGAAIALVLGATSVDAAAVYVTAGGRTGTDGSTRADALSSTFLANSAAVPGDDVRLLPGNYAGTDSLILCPLNAGGSAGDGTGIIQFSGMESDGTTPNSSGTVTINGDLTVSTPYTYLNGLHITGSLTIDPTANRCRITNCTIDGDLYLNGADYTTLVGCTFNGHLCRIAPESNSCRRDTLANCLFTSLGPGDGINYPIMLGVGGAGIDSSAFMFNTYYITQVVEAGLCGSPCGHEWWSEMSRFVTKSEFRGEHRYITCPLGSEYRRRFRDGTSNNHIDCDTTYATGLGAAAFWVAVSGDGITAFPANNDIDSSYYDFKGCASSNGLYFQVYPNGMDLTYTTVIGRAHALLATGAIDTRINHCTFVADGGLGVLRWENNTNVDDHVAFRGAPGLTFTNNVVALLAPYTTGQSISAYSPDYEGRVCVSYSQAVLDSAWKLDVQSTCVANNNAYSYWGSVNTVGDRSLAVYDDNLVTFGKPGDNQPVEARYNQLDSLSVFGSMRFVDSTLATFNPRITALSRARGVGTSGSDAGAVAYTATATYGTTNAYTVRFVRGQAASYTALLYNSGDADGTWDFSGFTGITEDWLAYNTHLYPTVTDGEVSAGSSASVAFTYDGSLDVPAGTYHMLMEAGNDPTLPLYPITVNGTTVYYPYITWVVVVQ